MNHMVVFPVLSGCMCKHIWCKYFLVETEMSVSVNTSVCDSEIFSPLCFWPVELDNSKVLRKQRQRDVNMAKVTLLQIRIKLISLKVHVKTAGEWNHLERLGKVQSLWASARAEGNLRFWEVRRSTWIMSLLHKYAEIYNTYLIHGDKTRSLWLRVSLVFSARHFLLISSH